MPTLDLPAASLRYCLDGPSNAPVLVLSNSLGTDLHLWDAQIESLTKHFRVLRYDTRGHGGSSAATTESSLADLGTDVLGLLDALCIDRFHICGISLGGITAIWLAIHAPRRVAGIMPCNTAARVGSSAGWTERIGQIAAGGMVSIADATMDRWFTPAFRESQPKQVESTRQMLLRTNPAGYMSCCAALRDADLSTELFSITAPTLVISGTYDPVTPPSDGLLLHENIPAARFRELPASHLSNIEAAPAFLAAVLEFMGVQQ